jgi:endoglucanase
MNEELKQAIFSLCSTMSISGFETRMGVFLKEIWGKEFDEAYTDSVGNHVFLRRCGRPNAPLILVDTHFDEIGMMVTEVCEKGFLRLAPIGGLSPCVLQAADVIVYGKKTVRGVIISTPPHLRNGKENQLPDVEELMVDTGYSKEEMEQIAPVGTPVGFAPVYGELLNGILTGKSFDNKACAAIAAYAILHTPKENLCADVALLLSSYEETSRIGGAGPATFGLSPDYAMVIDVNLATVPDVPKYETVPMGKGISLSVSAATDRALTRATQVLCKQKEIAHCMVAAPSSTGTNAMTVNLTGGGVPVVDVGLPLRSMHTYNEEISMEDADSLCSLVREFISSAEIAQAFSADGRKELPV